MPLRLMIVGCVPFTVIIYVLSFYHVARHAKDPEQHGTGGKPADITLKREDLIAICLLPMVYSAMALDSVLLTLDIMGGSSHSTYAQYGNWTLKEQIFELDYESNYATAD